MLGSWKIIVTTRDGSLQLLELWGPVCRFLSAEKCDRWKISVNPLTIMTFFLSPVGEHFNKLFNGVTKMENGDESAKAAATPTIAELGLI